MSYDENLVPDGAWMRIDLHIHTPASEDYEAPNASFLEILKEAERRELRIIAFTDHNTVHGYEQFRNEVEFLRRLAEFDRCTAEERERLAEYERLLAAILVLPGFEFTSQDGRHLLGVFDPQTPVSVLEAMLLQLGVPSSLLKTGTATPPGTRPIFEAFESIARNGGLVIGAHVNRDHGLLNNAPAGLSTITQTLAGLLQSPALHALEFVDATAPELFSPPSEPTSRPIAWIQGSNAHCVRRTSGDMLRSNGIGERFFEAALPEVSFAALAELLLTADLAHIRVPQRDLREHELSHLRSHGDSRHQLLRPATPEYLATAWQDLTALANVDGGVLLLLPTTPALIPAALADQLIQALEANLEVAPQITVDAISSDDESWLRVEVLPQLSPPWMTRTGQLYVRREQTTALAQRDEVLHIARRALAAELLSPLDNGEELDLPRSGVEIVGEQKRNGIWNYEVRDLRTTTGVERDRAQGLWAYAIARHEDLRDGTADMTAVRWHGRLGVWRVFQQGNRTKYDLVHRDAAGVITHMFYGVSEWGLSESWQHVLNLYTPVEHAPEAAEEPVETFEAAQPDDELSHWGERHYRWKGRAGIGQIHFIDDDLHFDLVMLERGTDAVRYFNDVPRSKLKDSWLPTIVVEPPTTGIEVVEIVNDERGRMFRFRNLRSGEISDPWREEDLESGTVREYAARMYLRDLPIDDVSVRWWGNLGYTRPMRSQVDLIYRDEHGVDHIYYAARRDELEDIWGELLQQWPDE